MMVIVFLTVLSLLLPMSLVAAPVEVLQEGGVSVSFEKTGDDIQIRRFRSQILPEIRRIVGQLATDLGGSKANNVRVYFYSPETYANKFPHTVGKKIPAFYTASGVHARADNRVDDSLRRTLRHELTHLIIDKNFGNVPAWLNEGLAMYQERKITSEPAPDYTEYNSIYIANQDGKYRSLTELDNNNIFGRSHGTVASKLAYIIAYIAVYELQKKSGMGTIRRYLKSVGQGKDPRSQFQAAFGMSYDQFSKKLIEISKRRT